MEEPGRLLSMGSHRVRHDWSHLAAAVAVCIFLKKTFPLVFAIYCLVVSKNMHLLSHSVCIHESRHSSAGASASGSLTKLQSRCWPKVSQKASVKVNWARSTSKTKVTLLSNPFANDTPLFLHILFTRNKLPSPAHSRRERITEGHDHQEVGLIEGCLWNLPTPPPRWFQHVPGLRTIALEQGCEEVHPLSQLKKNNFPYLFLAVLDLHHCSGFSLVAAGRGSFSLWCAGFSLLWLLLLWNTASRALGLQELRSPGSGAQAQ